MFCYDDIESLIAPLPHYADPPGSRVIGLPACCLCAVTHTADALKVTIYICPAYDRGNKTSVFVLSKSSQQAGFHLYRVWLVQLEVWEVQHRA